MNTAEKIGKENHGTGSLPCSRHDLDSINQTKQYRLLASPLLKHLLLDPTLSDLSRRVWLYLYDALEGKPGQKASIKSKWLATEMQVSEITIKRSLKQLRQMGYLVVSETWLPSGSQGANQYEVRFPRAVTETVMKLPGRVASIRAQQKIKPAVETAPDDQKAKIENSGEQNKGCAVELVSDSHVEETINSPGSVTIDKESDVEMNSSVQPPSLSKDSGNQQSSAKNHLEAMQAMLKHGAGIDAISQKLGYDVAKKTVALLTERFAPKVVANKANGGIKHGGGEGFKCDAPKENNTSLKNIKNKTGGFDNLTLDTISQRRLTNGLCSVGYENSLLLEMINQVTFAVTSGQIPGESMLHRVNIAIKLVRQNRWSTPYGYQPTNPKTA